MGTIDLRAAVQGTPRIMELLSAETIDKVMTGEVPVSEHPLTKIDGLLPPNSINMPVFNEGHAVLMTQLQAIWQVCTVVFFLKKKKFGGDGVRRGFIFCKWPEASGNG